MHRVALSLFLALLVAGCASAGRGRGSDWPSLNPRPGEISPMVPRNVPGAAMGGSRCRDANGLDCAPPAAAVAPAAPDMPAPVPPPTLAAAQAELDALEVAVTQVESAAGAARAARNAASAAANGSAPDSAAGSKLEAAESALLAALAPLASVDYRRAALAESVRETADAAVLAPRLAALAGRIAALQPQ